MVLDEEALEAMLARGRAAEGKAERPKMELADASDHFEVYERKEPRPEAEPGPAPEETRSQAPAAEDFEVFEKTPEAPPAPEQSPEASEPVTEPPAPERAPTPSAEPAPQAPPQQTSQAPQQQARRRPEVWPPIRRSHAPERPSQPAPAPQAAVREAAQATPAPQAATTKSGSGARIAILQSTFNEELTGAMAKLAKDTATQRGATVTTHATVPGVYDMPLVAKHLLARDDVDALVVLGVVVKGETQHDELITFATAKTLQEVSLAADKPIGLGITGPGMTWEQAEARVGNAAHAVDAALALLRVPM